MNFSFSYRELTDIANFYILDEQKSEKMEFHLEPIDSGIQIHVTKFKLSFLTLKSKVNIRLENFSDGDLTMSIYFRNLLFDLVKKIVFLVILNLVKQKIKDPEDGVDISQFIHFSASTVTIEINKMLNAMTVPLLIEEIHDYRKKADIRFTVKKFKKVKEDTQKQISGKSSQKELEKEKSR